MQKKKNLELYAAETNSPLRVMLFEDKVHAGFPSPVDDFCLKHSIDLNHELIRHLEALGHHVSGACGRRQYD